MVLQWEAWSGATDGVCKGSLFTLASSKSPQSLFGWLGFILKRESN